MNTKNKKAESAISACMHTAPHAICCGGPQIAAQTFAGVSHFMHGIGGIFVGLGTIPLATYVANEASPYVMRAINNIKYKCFNKGVYDDAPVKKKLDNPFRWSWLKENKTKLAYGAIVQAGFLTFDAVSHLDHDGHHEGHDHATHIHYEDNRDETCTKAHEEGGELYYFGMYNKTLAKLVL